MDLQKERLKACERKWQDSDCKVRFDGTYGQKNGGGKNVIVVTLDCVCIQYILTFPWSCQGTELSFFGLPVNTSRAQILLPPLATSVLCRGKGKQQQRQAIPSPTMEFLFQLHIQSPVSNGIQKLCRQISQIESVT